ncbi:MAG: hydrogenase 4 subunit F [Elusimicrobia bacterium]|nr:hydrogenase 4 subunit F [Elusimicrobiota bacterium]
MALLSVCLAPLLTALACLLDRDDRAAERINVMGSAATFACAALLAAGVLRRGPLLAWGGFFRADALSAFMILIVAFLSLVSALYSVAYMRREAPAGALHWYYALYHAFTSTMLLAVLVDNLGALWIAIEATTLASTFLVGFHRSRHAVEAAWKYIVLCTVGIAFALLGTFLFYYASARGGAPTLSWIGLAGRAGELDPGLVRLGFIFVLFGYGTKAGLAPMHTWLPDAHSQAPTPVSALLSGVLLKCALYGVLRFHILAARSLGPDFSSRLLLGFGLLSLLVATPFILVQRDFKRLLAYHSVEHVGIVAVGLGFGGFWGVYGAMLHLLNHALAKALLFLGVGDIARSFGSRRLHRFSGVLTVLPVTGALFLVGALALAGLPPLGLFVSEFIIAAQGMRSGHAAACGLLVGLIAVILAGLLYHVMPVALGAPRRRPPERPSWLESAPLAVVAVLLLVLGLCIPGPLDRTLSAIAELVSGGPRG